MKILLVAKRWFRGVDHDNPIAVLDMAPLLRRQGHEVDCAYINALGRGEYDLVGFSCFAGIESDVRKEALALKAAYPRARIVVGGKYTEIMSDELRQRLTDDGIHVYSGEGERYFGEAAQISYEEYPSWDPADLRLLRIDGNNIMSSRGCPYRCSFCHNTAPGVNFFTPARTVDNIERLFAMGAEYVFFVDDIFTLNARHMSDIHKECKRRFLKIENRNQFFTHVSLINKESVKAMSALRPAGVQIGIESGDDRMLQLMNKNATADTIYDRIRLLSGHLPVDGLFMIGYPGETVQSLRNTVAFLGKIKKYLRSIWVGYYAPIPGTKGYEMALKNGVITSAALDNKNIGYIDNNLTAQFLEEARRRMYETMADKGLSRRAASFLRQLVKGARQNMAQYGR